MSYFNKQKKCAKNRPKRSNALEKIEGNGHQIIFNSYADIPYKSSSFVPHPAERKLRNNTSLGIGLISTN